MNIFRVTWESTSKLFDIENGVKSLLSVIVQQVIIVSPLEWWQSFGHSASIIQL